MPSAVVNRSAVVRAEVSPLLSPPRGPQFTATSPLSVEEEKNLIALGELGASDTLVVNMHEGSGSMTFLPGEARWCITPSLGICQAVCLASFSPEKGGRLSLTHFPPANYLQHRELLLTLSETHRREGYTSHYALFALPEHDSAGRYLAPMCCQAELVADLSQGLSPLKSYVARTIHYSHEYASACPIERSALVMRLLPGPQPLLLVDLFGCQPFSLW